MSLLLLLHSDGSGVAQPPWLANRLYRPARRVTRFAAPPRRIYPLGGPLLFDSATDSAGTALESHIPENGGTSWAWQTSTASRLAIVSRVAIPGLVFNGAAQVAISNVDTSTFSISVWCQRNDTARSGSVIVSDPTSGDVIIASNAFNGFGLYFDGVKIKLGKIGVGEVDGGTAWSDTKFHHLLMTHDGTDAKFYVDGELTTTIACAFTFSSVGGYWIGARAGAQYFLGKMTDLRIYNNVLTATDARTIYNRGYPSYTDGTVGGSMLAWWKMNDGSGSSLADSSGSANTGTITAATFATHSSLTASTKIAQTTNNATAVKATIDAGLADLVTFRAKVTIPAGSYAGDLIVRASPDAAAYVGYRIASAGTGVVVDGSITDGTVESYTPWQEYTFRIELLGTSVRIYRDDVMLFEKVTAINQSNRVYGFSSTSNNTGALTFDDLELYATPAPDWQPYVRLGRMAAERFYHRPPGPSPHRIIASLLDAIDQSLASSRQPLQLRPDPKATQAERQHQQRTAAVLNSLLRRREIDMIDPNEFTLGYTPEDQAQWGPGAPTTISEALDRLAEAIKLLTGNGP